MLEKALDEVFRESDIISHPLLEKPPREMGDLALPCFGLARGMKMAPAAIAKNIAKKLDQEKYNYLREYFNIVPKGPYVNFTLRNAPLLENILARVMEQGRKYGISKPKSHKIILEHTSANPNGPFHIGRSRNPIIGDTLARVLRRAGYDVEVQYWVNDMGRQAATLSWALDNVAPGRIKPLDPSNPNSTKKDHDLVRYYQQAYNEMEKEPELAGEIDQILYEIEEGNDKTKEKVQRCSKLVLEGMKESLGRINIEFDTFVWESESIENGSVENVINDLKASKYASREGNAWFLELEDFDEIRTAGRNTRFYFTRDNGTSLYTTRDLAYHLKKLGQADTAINILGEDHKLQAKQLGIALGILKSKTTPVSIFYSFVALEDGKMSTRKGRVIYLDDMMVEAIHRAYQEVEKRRPELGEDEKLKIAEMVGLGCIRYNIIRVQSDKKITFRWGDALNFEGDSSAFIQYAHARCCNIIQKAGGIGIIAPDGQGIRQIFQNVGENDIHPDEAYLGRLISAFPQVIEDVGRSYRLHHIPQYLKEIAGALNSFYQTCPVISEKDERKKKIRLCLIECCKIVLAEGLGTLGISAPESM